MAHVVAVDGLRIDTVKHVDTSFWPGFGEAAGVFITGEVTNGDPYGLCPYQNYMDSVLNYAMYVEIERVEKFPYLHYHQVLCGYGCLLLDCRKHVQVREATQRHEESMQRHQRSWIVLRKSRPSSLCVTDQRHVSGQEHHHLHDHGRRNSHHVRRPGTALQRRSRPIQPRSCLVEWL